MAERKMPENHQNPFKDFIESLEALNHLQGKEKLIIHDIDREYFLAILDHYQLPKNKKLAEIFINAIKQAKTYSGFSLPNLIAAYLQMLLWDFFLKNEEKPFYAVLQGFWFGYAFRQFIEFEIREPPDKRGGE